MKYGGIEKVIRQYEFTHKKGQKKKKKRQSLLAYFSTEISF